MPSPVTPNVFKDLIPRFQSSMCGRFIPTITNFIRRFTDFYEWMFNEDGSFTDDFKTDLCALGCTEVGLCPSLNLAPVMVARAGAVDLTFTVSGPVPYDWELFRATDPAGPWGAAIDTGTGEADSTLEITDATAVNDTTYYYKLVVSKTDCADVSYITGSVTPTACYLKGNMISFTLTQGEASLTVGLARSTATPIPDGTAVEVWRSTVADAIGDQVNTGAFAGGTFTYTDSGLTVGTRYHYTVKVQQTGGCQQFEIRREAYAITNDKLDGPDLVLVGNGITWEGQDGIDYYWVSAKSHCGGGSAATVPGTDIDLVGTVPLSAGSDTKTNKWRVNLTLLPMNCKVPGIVNLWGLIQPSKILQGSELDQLLRAATNNYATKLQGTYRGGKIYTIYVVGWKKGTNIITRPSVVNYSLP